MLITIWSNSWLPPHSSALLDSALLLAMGATVYALLTPWREVALIRRGRGGVRMMRAADLRPRRRAEQASHDA